MSNSTCTNRNVRDWLLTRSALIAFVILTPATSFAQSTSTDTDSRDGDVVVVTATRSATALDRLPTQIDVIDRDDIELNNIETLADALAFTPGINAVQSGPAGSITSVFTRGSNSKHTLALFDGIRLNDASTPNGQYNFGQDLLGEAERVEVVRGPLSSVYGSDAVGGVVNVIPRLGAEDGFSPYFEASYGSFDTYRGVVGAAGTLDRLVYNVTLEAFQTDGFDEVPDRFSTHTGDEDGAEFITFTSIAKYDLGNGFGVDGLLRMRNAESQFDTFSGGPTGFQRADDDDIGVGKDDYSVWRLGGSWQNTAGTFESELRGGQVSNERNSVNDGMVTDTAEGDRDFAEWLNIWTPGQLAFLLDTSVSFGAQYQREEINVAPEFSDPLERDESSWGAYVLTTAGLTESFDLTASLRLDDFENFGQQTTYNLGGVFHADAIRTRFRGSWGTSFKAPTLSERFSSSAFTSPNPDLEPEEGETWEVGFNTMLPLFAQEDGLDFGVTYFDSEIDNLIENVFDFVTFTGQNQNVGKAEITGYEAYIDLSPVETFRFRVDYTYTDAINANTDARLLRRPPHSWSASTEWRPHQDINLSLRYLFVGERTDVLYDDDGNFVTSGCCTADYDLFTLSGTWQLTEALQAFASVNNLLDEEYEQPNAYRGAPRSSTIGLRGRF